MTLGTSLPTETPSRFLLLRTTALNQAGRPHETLLTAGQTAGGITEILPVAEIMRRLVTKTEAALLRAGASA